jgi:serine/threonine protein kinase
MLPTGLENYHVIDLVGEGSFGKVNQAVHSSTRQRCFLCMTHMLEQSPAGAKHMIWPCTCRSTKADGDVQGRSLP